MWRAAREELSRTGRLQSPDDDHRDRIDQKVGADLAPGSRPHACQKTARAAAVTTDSSRGGRLCCGRGHLSMSSGAAGPGSHATPRRSVREASAPFGGSTTNDMCPGAQTWKQAAVCFAPRSVPMVAQKHRTRLRQTVYRKTRRYPLFTHRSSSMGNGRSGGQFATCETRMRSAKTGICAWRRVDRNPCRRP